MAALTDEIGKTPTQPRSSPRIVQLCRRRGALRSGLRSTSGPVRIDPTGAVKSRRYFAYAFGAVTTSGRSPSLREQGPARDLCEVGGRSRWRRLRRANPWPKSVKLRGRGGFPKAQPGSYPLKITASAGRQDRSSPWADFEIRYDYRYRTSATAANFPSSRAKRASVKTAVVEGLRVASRTAGDVRRR